LLTFKRYINIDVACSYDELQHEAETLFDLEPCNHGRIQTSVLGGAINIGLMALLEGAILRNPYLSHVNFPVLGGTIAPVALPLDPPLLVTMISSNHGLETHALEVKAFNI